MASITDLEDRYDYIQEVWSKMYGESLKPQKSAKAIDDRFKALRNTDLEKYADALEDFVEYMEEASIYVKPT